MIGKTVALRRTDTVRLVNSARLREPALKPLADDDDDDALDLLARLESATNGRMRAEESGLAGLDPRELVFGIPNYSFVNAAFTYPRPGGNRFNDDRRGAWYCGFDVKTALAEIVYHLTRALADADNAFDNVTDYAVLYADFNGPFLDLRDLDGSPRCLHENPVIGYPAGQALARQVLGESDELGIVYPSVRNAGGTCLAALYPYVVQNVRQGGLWRLTWSGSAEPTVTALVE